MFALNWPTRMPAMLGSEAWSLPTNSRKAAFSCMPSMSTARRGGEAMKVCVVLRGASDSSVTRL